MATTTSKTLSFTQTDAELKELFARTQELADLGGLAGIIGWDQAVKMPPEANQIRGPQFGTLQVIIQERQTAPRLKDLFTALEKRVQGGGFTDADRGLVRKGRRDYDQAAKIPPELLRQLVEAGAEAWGAWEKAKPANDYPSYAPHLGKVVELSRKLADCLGYTGSRYNALLDIYEPEMTLEKLNPILNRVRAATVDLLKRIQASGHTVDTAALHGTFDEARQLDFCTYILKQMGYRFEAGRMDKSSHPFTGGGGSPYDVRVTVRVDPTYWPMAVMAAIHEGGHAVYEQGSDPVLARTILAGGASMGLHESESRLWENYIGRSLPFWKRHFPALKERFPEAYAARSVEEVVTALNNVKPSFIRVEADEVTYNLHIIIRFELEQELINGTLDVNDLPRAWSQKYQDYLGITPDTDTVGVMQDIHWSQGSFGYFPTYTLGNLYGAQIHHTLRKAFKDYDHRLEHEGTGFIHSWLQEHMYAYGQVYAPTELARKVTGEDLNPDYFVEYINKKYGAIYHLK